MLQTNSVYFKIEAVLPTMMRINDKAFVVLVYFSLFCGLFCVEFIDEQRVREIENVINNYTFYPPLDNKTDGRTPIVFGLIVSFGGSFNSSGAVPGVRVALDQINNSSDLLPGYSLHYALSDSQVCMHNNNYISLQLCRTSCDKGAPVINFKSLAKTLDSYVSIINH